MAAEQEAVAPQQREFQTSGEKTLAQSTERASEKTIGDLQKDSMSDKDKQDKEKDSKLVTENKVNEPDKDVKDMSVKPDGSINTEYNDGRPDGLKSKTERDITDGGNGKQSEKQYEGRKDGLKSQTTFDGNGEKTVTNEYEPGKGKDGVLKESTKTKGDNSVTTRDFDPDKNPDGVKSEKIERNSKDKSEISTQTLKDNSTVETTKRNGEVLESKKFDPSGKQIIDKSTGDKKDETGDKDKDKTGEKKDETSDKDKDKTGEKKNETGDKKQEGADANKDKDPTVAKVEQLPDGSVKTTYTGRSDGLQSKIERNNPDGAQGRHTESEYSGRPDGLKKQTTFDGSNGTKSETKEFDDKTSANGIRKESTVTKGDKTTTERSFDADKHPNKVQSEKIESDSKGLSDKISQTMKDGSSTEITRQDGRDVETKKYDKDGKNVETQPDGSVKTTYKDGTRSDGLKSTVERDVTDGKQGRSVENEYSGRPDGLKKENSFKGTDGKETINREYEPGKGKDGVLKETYKKDGDKQSLERSYDADKNPKNLKSEKFEVDSKDKTEKHTQTMKDGTKTEVSKKDGKEVGSKTFHPKGEEGKDKVAEPKKDDPLAKHKSDLEGLKLPPLKRGQGPYQALQEAQKQGLIPKMDHKETLAEAKRIRDRDFKERGSKHYKQGEGLKLSKEYIDKSVEAKGKELGVKPGEKTGPEAPKKTGPDAPKTPETNEAPDKKVEKKVEKKDEPAKKSDVPIDNKGASKEFTDKIDKTLENLPEGAKKALKDGGVKIATGGGVMSDMAPQVKGKDIPGQPKGVTWDHSDGLFEPKSKTAVIPEKQIDMKTGQPTKVSENAIPDQIGRAVDAQTGISKSDGFQQALLKDVAKMPKEQQEQINKALGDPSNIGKVKEEAYKQLFRAMYGPGKDSPQSKGMLKFMPESAKYIQDKLK